MNTTKKNNQNKKRERIEIPFKDINEDFSKEVKDRKRIISICKRNSRRRSWIGCLRFRCWWIFW